MRYFTKWNDCGPRKYVAGLRFPAMRKMQRKDRSRSGVTAATVAAKRFLPTKGETLVEEAFRLFPRYGTGSTVAGGRNIRCHWVLSALTAAVHYDAVKCDGAAQRRNHFDPKCLFRAVRLLRLAISGRNLKHVNYINNSTTS